MDAVVEYVPTTEARFDGIVKSAPRKHHDRETSMPVIEFELSLDQPCMNFGEMMVEVRGERLIDFVADRFGPGATVMAVGEPYVVTDETGASTLRCESTSVGITANLGIGA